MQIKSHLHDFMPWNLQKCLSRCMNSLVSLVISGGLWCTDIVYFRVCHLYLFARVRQLWFPSGDLFTFIEVVWNAIVWVHRKLKHRYAEKYKDRDNEFKDKWECGIFREIYLHADGNLGFNHLKMNLKTSFLLAMTFNDHNHSQLSYITDYALNMEVCCSNGELRVRIPGRLPRELRNILSDQNVSF